MRKLLVVVLGLLFVCSFVFAADEAKATKAETHKKMAPMMTSDHLNNVIKMDADGNRTALCACSKEFQVTDASPKFMRGDETDYCCTPGCHDMYMSASKEAQTKMMSEYWSKSFPFDKMVNNTYTAEGKKMATCLCGKAVEVNDKTPKLTENGVTMYLCSDACNTLLHGMAAKDRMDKEVAMVKAQPKPEMKADKQQ